jgi:hypothetical protein
MYIGADMETNSTENEYKNDLIEGRNAVIEALRAGRTIDKILISSGDTDKTLGHIASKARDAGIVVVDCDRRKLDAMSVTKAHQGVIAICAVKEYCTIEDILASAEEKRRGPLRHSLRRDKRRAQSRRHNPLRGMCRSPRNNHSQAAKRWPDRHCGQGLRRSGRARHGGQSAQYPGGH